MSSLLTTKLYQPPLPAKPVPRLHLLQRLNEGLALGRRLTLVSAPAGFGKTTCVSAWVKAITLPTAWLSLEVADNDAVRFFAYLVAALQPIAPTLGGQLESGLRSGQLPQPDTLSTLLVNELLALDERIVLVLDDFHLIQEPVILQVFEKLVANLPPTLHLVLVTREDPALPLTRLRANNQLTEIRAAELRFNGDEARQFLTEVMSLPLHAADINRLEDKTEGWVVGLQLAAFSLRNQANPSAFITSLSGSHRHILSYLAEEVLNHQPEAIQQFLLQTALLERLNGDLCNAVTGRADSHELLEQLLSANLFLVPLDDNRCWYRYYHLFSDLLRNLQPSRLSEPVAALHRRASQWYAAAGMVSEAIQHALAGADYEMAVGLLEDHATEMIVQGYAKTVAAWLNAIPPELRQHSPRTNMAFIWMHLTQGTYRHIAPYLERLQARFAGTGLDAEPNLALKAEWLALQASLCLVQENAEESRALAEQALALAPAEDSFVRSLAYNGLACAQLLHGNYAEAVAAYQQAILHSRTTTNFVSEILGISTLTQVAWLHGQLHFAEEIAAQAVSRMEHSQTLPPVSGIVYAALGQVFYQRYQLEAARQHLNQALQTCTLGGYRDGEIYCRAALARLLQTEDQQEAAAEQLRQAAELLQAGAPTWIVNEVVAQRVRLALTLHQPVAAETALKNAGFSFQGQLAFPPLAPDQGLSYEAGRLYNSALSYLAYQRQYLQPGIELADTVITAAQRTRFLPIVLEARLLRAQLQAALGERVAAQADCAAALELAEPEGFVALFVEGGQPIASLLHAVLQNPPPNVTPEFVQAVLAAFPTPAEPDGRRPSTDDTETFESLSARELEVLHLISEGCSNQSIAERLVLSPHTVKKHISNIFLKLGVDSRTQALARARQMGWL